MQAGTDPFSVDSDGDFLTDEQEALYGTDPLSPDTDGDGYLDGHEVHYGTNPTTPPSAVAAAPDDVAAGLAPDPGGAVIATEPDDVSLAPAGSTTTDLAADPASPTGEAVEIDADAVTNDDVVQVEEAATPTVEPEPEMGGPSSTGAGAGAGADRTGAGARAGADRDRLAAQRRAGARHTLTRRSLRGEPPPRRPTASPAMRSNAMQALGRLDRSGRVAFGGPSPVGGKLGGVLGGGRVEGGRRIGVRVRLDNGFDRVGQAQVASGVGGAELRSARPRPTIDRSQRIIVEARLPKPARKARCTKNQTIHAGNPLRRILPTLAMARNRPIVATLPRSRYLNGNGPSPLSRRRIVLAAWRPPCMATSATPGQVVQGGHVSHGEHLGMTRAA